MSPFIYVGICACVVLVLAGVFRVEDARGGALVVLGAPRRLFDRLVCFMMKVGAVMHGYVRYSILRIFFHYIAHRVLKRLYATTHYLETKTEELLRQNRRVARRIGVEKRDRTHLDAMVAHKEKTSLSKEQIDQLRSLD